MFSQGVQLLEEGNPEAAIREFRHALSDASTDGQKADALYNIAVCHVRLGSVDAAVEAIAEAMAIDPALAAEFRNDPDFAPLSSNSAFHEALGDEEPDVAEGVLDRLVDDFLDENMSGSAWRRGLISWMSRRSTTFLFAIGILALYRIGRYIPIPGVNPDAVALFDEFRDREMLDLFGLVTGSNFSRLSIFMLGITPYVYASIYEQIAAFVWRRLTPEADGRDRPWGVWVTGVVALLLCIWQASRMAVFIERQSNIPGGFQFVAYPGWTFRIIAVLTLTSGTACFMWLSDYITRRRIANGMLLIVVVGIVAGLPDQFEAARAQPWRMVISLALAIAVVALTARGYRRALEAA